MGFCSFFLFKLSSFPCVNHRNFNVKFSLFNIRVSWKRAKKTSAKFVCKIMFGLKNLKKTGGFLLNSSRWINSVSKSTNGFNSHVSLAASSQICIANTFTKRVCMCVYICCVCGRKFCSLVIVFCECYLKAFDILMSCDNVGILIFLWCW